MAQNILISKYPTDVAPVVTFCNDYGFLNREVRRNLVGGFAGPIQLRHVELGDIDPKYDKSVYYAPCGQKYTNICQYDANSLYPYTMLGKQPTGVGVYLRRLDESDVNFKPELMIPAETYPKHSKISLEFLDMMQGSPLFTGRFGKVLMHCAATTGEKKIGPYFLGNKSIIIVYVS